MASHNSNSALESSHAIWEGVRLAKTLPKDQDIVIVSVSYVIKQIAQIGSVPIGAWRQGRGADLPTPSQMGRYPRLACRPSRSLKPQDKRLSNKSCREQHDCEKLQIIYTVHTHVP